MSLTSQMSAEDARNYLRNKETPQNHGELRHLEAALERVIFDTPGDQNDGGGNTIDIAGDVRDRYGNAVTSKRRLRWKVGSGVTVAVQGEGTAITGDGTNTLTMETTAAGAFTIRATYAAGALSNEVLRHEVLDIVGPLPFDDVSSQKRLTFNA